MTKPFTKYLDRELKKAIAKTDAPSLDNKPLTEEAKNGQVNTVVNSEFGWMIFNDNIPVYPSLRTTRRICIYDYTEKHSRNWKELTSHHRFDCRKVEIRY